ncbi:MAG: sulfite exporter TauE/SafE family protein [Bacteroidetes bacterium]|nr:sulfite exporter TauE/SafE family protein [Bacteroidota bacterium]
MNAELITIPTIIGLAFIHTVAGPDHYLPFIAISKHKHWSWSRTGWLTFFCGIGHIISSVLLGLVGAAAGIALVRLEQFQDIRGSIVAWALMVFGLGYTIWGLLHLWRHSSRKPHIHLWQRTRGDNHGQKKELTPWVLFIIFVFGPCEVLIPMLFYYGLHAEYTRMAVMSLLFGAVTIATMITIVYIAYKGLTLVRFGFLKKAAPVITGSVILLCGAGIQFFGL